MLNMYTAERPGVPVNNNSNRSPSHTQGYIGPGLRLLLLLTVTAGRSAVYMFNKLYYHLVLHYQLAIWFLLIEINKRRFCVLCSMWFGWLRTFQAMPTYNIVNVHFPVHNTLAITFQTNVHYYNLQAIFYKCWDLPPFGSWFAHHF